MENIHGYPIIAKFTFGKQRITRYGRVVLVAKPALGHATTSTGDPDTCCEFVVARQFADSVEKDGKHIPTRWDSEWDAGHYFLKLDDALVHFKNVVERWKS